MVSGQTRPWRPWRSPSLRNLAGLGLVVGLVWSAVVLERDLEKLTALKIRYDSLAEGFASGEQTALLPGGLDAQAMRERILIPRDLERSSSQWLAHRVSTIAEEVGADVLHAESFAAVPPGGEVDNPLREVNARLRVRLSHASLQALLHGLETMTPWVIMDSLVIHPPQDRSDQPRWQDADAGTVPTAFRPETPSLVVTIRCRGYTLAPSGAARSPATARRGSAPGPASAGLRPGPSKSRISRDASAV